MNFTLLGTGCPQCDPKRMGPTNLVRAGERRFLIDCGSGVTQRLVEAGSNGRELDALFFTHLHSDHTIDLMQLVISSWHQGRNSPQRIFGPQGTTRFVEGLMAFWEPEFAQRIAHERRPSSAALGAIVEEIEEGVIWQDDQVLVRAVRVEHAPIKHAFGFVFESAGRKLAFSGDTRYCEALIAAAEGADALVHECFIHGEMLTRPGRNEAGIASIASYHTLSTEVGKVATDAKVKMLVLNHFVPTQFDRSRLLDEVRVDWSGPLVIGEDLMRIDLAQRTVLHRDGLIAFGGG